MSFILLKLILLDNIYLAKFISSSRDSNRVLIVIPILSLFKKSISIVEVILLYVLVACSIKLVNSSLAPFIFDLKLSFLAITFSIIGTFIQFIWYITLDCSSVDKLLFLNNDINSSALIYSSSASFLSNLFINDSIMANLSVYFFLFLDIISW